MSESRTAGEAARAIADALDRASLPYAIGGALALAVAGVPRGTQDVDINVFVLGDAIRDVVRALHEVGVKVDESVALAESNATGMFIGTWDGMRIDVFVPSIDFAYEAGRTAVTVTVDGWSGRFLSPEAIAVFKLLFFRLKDRADLERLVAVRRSEFDHAYVRRWVVDMMGETDERTVAWDDIVRRLGPRD